MSKPKAFFGQLEQAILDALWDDGPGTVRQVLDRLRSRRLAYTTVMTVMNRLVDQGIVRRQPGPGGVFTYSPRQTRQSMTALLTRQTLDQLVREYGDVALVQFMDRLDRIPADKLARLRRQLKHHHDA